MQKQKKASKKTQEMTRSASAKKPAQAAKKSVTVVKKSQSIKAHTAKPAAKSAAAASKAAPKVDRKAAAKKPAAPAPKAATKTKSVAPAAKADHKPDAHAKKTSKAEPKSEPRSESKVEPKVEVKATKAAPKAPEKVVKTPAAKANKEEAPVETEKLAKKSSGPAKKSKERDEDAAADLEALDAASDESDDGVAIEEAPKRAKRQRDDSNDGQSGEDDEVVLTDADGRRYCRVKDCDQASTVDGYCRYHYLLFWKNIQNRKKILSEGKLDRYVEELTARYPDKYLELLRKDLRSEKDFTAAIQELEIDESGVDNEFEDEAQSYLDEVRGMSSETPSEREEDF